MKENYKGLGHIAIYTENLEESIAFYERIGGELKMRSRSHGVGVSKDSLSSNSAVFCLNSYNPPRQCLSERAA